jgi:hypothetical protein
MNPEVKRIIRDIGGAFGVSHTQIMARSRQSKHVEARWYSWYALYLRGYTQQEIGRIWQVHHSAVGHAIQRIRFWIDTGEHHTAHVVHGIRHLLAHQMMRYRYQVQLSGSVLVESSRELGPATVRERALVNVGRGECKFTVTNTDFSEVSAELEAA